MAPAEFHLAVNTLGIAQGRVAELFGVGARSVRRWQRGDRRTPIGIGILFCLLQTGAVTIAQVEAVARTNGGEPEAPVDPTRERSVILAESALPEPSAAEVALLVEFEPAVVERPSELEPRLEQFALADGQPAALADLPLSARTNAEPVEVRREKAKELVDAGMSVRGTAKALGVSKSTVQRDVSQSGPENGPKRSSTKAERRAEREQAAVPRTNGAAPESGVPKYISVEATDEPLAPLDSEANLFAPLPFAPEQDVDPVIVESSLGEKVASLTSTSCHWPIGDPANPGFPVLRLFRHGPTILRYASRAGLFVV
jgi:hypothetical protein